MAKISVLKCVSYALSLYRRSRPIASKPSSSNTPLEDLDTASINNNDTLVSRTLYTHESTDSSTRSSETNVLQLDNMSRFPVTPRPNTPVFRRGDKTQRGHDIKRIAVAYTLSENQMLKDIFVLLSRLIKIQHKEPTQRVDQVIEFAQTCGSFIIQLGKAYGADAVQSSSTVIALQRLLQGLIVILPTQVVEDHDEKKDIDVDRHLSMLFDILSALKIEFPEVDKDGIDGGIQQSKVDIVIEASVTILDLIRDGCDLVPPACVKPAIGLACALIKAVKKTRTNHQDMHDLSELVSEFIISVVAFLSEANMDVPHLIESAFNEFNHALQQIVEDCLILANKSLVSRFLQQGKDSDTIGGLKAKLHIAIEVFQFKSQILQYSNFHDVTKLLNDKLDYDVLRSLPSNLFFEGKRDDFLSDMQDDILERIGGWIEDSSSPVFLLLGGAGLGKSCISHQLVYHLMDAERLAAQMFLSRGSILQQNLVTIFQTLARDLGSMHPGTVPKIAAATRLGGSSHDSPAAYFQRYILDPIRSLSLSQPLILILDALDECEAHKLILQVFSEVSDLSGIKIFLTSRPGSSAIMDFTTLPYITTVNLKRLTQEKMECYISSRFNRIKWDYERPSRDDVSNLAKLADGLIIWAAVSCNLIANDMQEDDPNEVLQKIISSSKDVLSDDQLPTLYHTTLTHLFEGSQVERFVRVFQMMLVIQEPMSVETFGTIFHIGVRQIRAVHSTLSALEIYETDDKEIIIPATQRFHSSFLEYITQSQSSSITNPFYINPRIAHSTVSISCLLQIQSLTASDPTFSYPNLEHHAKYAVCHWPFHLTNGVQELSSQKRLAEEGIYAWYPFCLLASESLSIDLEGSGHRQAIDKAISFHTHSLRLFEITGKEHAEASSDFGFALWRRYERDGSIQDLEDSIEMHTTFLSSHPASDLPRARALSRVGHALWARFMTVKSSPQGIDEAISMLNEALGIYETHSITDHRTLSSLASALRIRFEETEAEEDLNTAIALQKRVIEMAALDKTFDVTRARNNLATCLISRFEVNAAIYDLDEAISILRDILHIRPIGHQHRSSTLNNLAFCLQHRYEHSGIAEDLEEAMVMNHEVLESRPTPHRFRAQTLINLALCLRYRFERQNMLDDLNKAILMGREALELRPTPHPYRLMSLNRLGLDLLISFQHNNNRNDLHEAVDLLMDVIASCPDTHRDYPVFLNNLGVALRTRFQETGSEKDLADAVSMQRKALGLYSKQNVDYPLLLNRLVATLLTLYAHTQSDDLLEEITKVIREASHLWPISQPYSFQSFNNLARLLYYTYIQTRRQIDLEEARALYHKSLICCPPPHPSRPVALEGLAQLAQSCFEHTDSLEHLDDWINRCRELFMVVSPTRQRYKVTAEGFHNALRIRFERTGNSKDIDEFNHFPI